MGAGPRAPHRAPAALRGRPRDVLSESRMREIRTSGSTSGEEETELWRRLRHRHHGESRRQQLLPRPGASAPLLDSTVGEVIWLSSLTCGTQREAALIIRHSAQLVFRGVEPAPVHYSIRRSSNHGYPAISLALPPTGCSVELRTEATVAARLTLPNAASPSRAGHREVRGIEISHAK
jgi:hypothetical protein